MFNMRIDVIRKELERRFNRIFSLKDSSEMAVRNEVCKLFYFLLSTDGLRDFVLDLSRYNEKFRISKEYNLLKSNIIAFIKKIAVLIEESNFISINQEIENKLPNPSIPLFNHFGIQNPAVDRDHLSFNQYVDCLKTFDKYFEESINNLGSILGTIGSIFSFADDQGWQYDHGKYHEIYDRNLLIGLEKFQANLGLRSHYEGVDSVIKLLAIYFHSQYRHLVDIKDSDLGIELHQELDRFRLNAHINVIDTIADYEALYHAVDKYLMTGKSKNALIERLKTYCMWFKLEEFWREGIKEEDISKIIEEYIFSLGYYPIVNPRTGRSIYDILAEPGENLRWDNSVLIELKQRIGKSYSDKQFRADVGQARDYLSIVKGVKPDVADSVYLLIFYAGNARYVLDKSFSDDNVQVEFIYVGEKTPSKLKDGKIFGKQ